MLKWIFKCARHWSNKTKQWRRCSDRSCPAVSGAATRHAAKLCRHFSSECSFSYSWFVVVVVVSGIWSFALRQVLLFSYAPFKKNTVCG